ncbi:MAG: helix-turn-helix transcriptional regulator [Desulfosarcina sp.]|nr:helix-turn-helix transcriptional regulator [Desulfosarcina sp.]MBC2744144.1 helix-turn-helix transcriptional regulator [Desulfosarcina sp.]MBC2767053.1 helix-turn-helix transcriptional regulator [Desulfosarcina sp.]
MLEHTKKRHTDKTVVLTFLGPESNRQAAIDNLSRLGYVDTSDSIPWRKAFPEFEGNESGTVLRGARLKAELTQKALAEKTGIPQRHISEMENGKRTIGKKRAEKLAKTLNTPDYRVFL